MQTIVSKADKTYLTPGMVIHDHEINYSEAAMFTMIAGTRQTVRVINDRAGEIIDTEGHPISGAYLLCELGFYSDTGIF